MIIRVNDKQIEVAPFVACPENGNHAMILQQLNIDAETICESELLYTCTTPGCKGKEVVTF